MARVTSITPILAAFGGLLIGSAELTALVPADDIRDSWGRSPRPSPSIAYDVLPVDREKFTQGPVASAKVLILVEVAASRKSTARQILDVLEGLLDAAHLEPEGMRPMLVVLSDDGPDYMPTSEPDQHRWLVNAESVAQAAAA